MESGDDEVEKWEIPTSVVVSCSGLKKKKGVRRKREREEELRKTVMEERCFMVEWRRFTVSVRSYFGHGS
ncbi:hypothetical protein Hanom_Chr10g00919961 [Helianthus anomalus]